MKLTKKQIEKISPSYKIKCDGCGFSDGGEGDEILNCSRGCPRLYLIELKTGKEISYNEIKKIIG